jgi:hypothetical protein
MAIRQALRIVAHFVLPKEANGTCEPDLDAKIRQEVLEPLRALEAIVDELAVVAERVSEQQYDGGGADKNRKGRPTERETATNQSTRRHADEPERLDRRPPDGPEPHVRGV